MIDIIREYRQLVGSRQFYAEVIAIPLSFVGLYAAVVVLAAMF